ncbi:MAG: hypothetical protein R2852_07300 [Bacteroidia bacterium]
MKQIAIITVCFLLNTISAQEQVQKKDLNVFLELGHSTSSFIGSNFNQVGRNTSKVSFYKLGVKWNKFSLFGDLKDYSDFNRDLFETGNPKVIQAGTYRSNYYRVYDFGLAYSFNYKNKLFLEPSILYSTRFEGGEEFYQTDFYTGFICATGATYYYGYRNEGLGLGLNVKQRIYKGLYLGFETQYNRYFSLILKVKKILGMNL